MDLCAGNCRPDFDIEAYKQRLELAKIALQKGHQKFLKHLQKEIEKHNQNLEFEKSKELHQYLQAFGKVFDTLETTNHPHSPVKTLTIKDIWILSENKKSLFLFHEKGCALKQKKLFCFPFNNQKENQHIEYFTGYYRSHMAPNTILVNFEINKKEKELFEQFLKQWHKKDYDISITKPKSGHFASLVNLATIQMQQELKKQKSLPKALKTLLKLSAEPKTIDCFDISQRQGMFMVGSCIRFKDGKPDKDNFRRFKIKTVDHQDDYSCLQEIVKRRYSNKKDIPDLILIDGGKGQLRTVTKILPKANIISLAKREETVFAQKLPLGKKLNLQKHASLILIALRDYAHHFAINYHRKLTKF
jgi:excinuclease ABC subunit C